MSDFQSGGKKLINQVQTDEKTTQSQTEDLTKKNKTKTRQRVSADLLLLLLSSHKDAVGFVSGGAFNCNRRGKNKIN